MRHFLSLLLFVGLTLSAQDLFDERGEIFTDNKPLAVGSVVTILFDDQLVLNYQSQLQRQSQKNLVGSDFQSELFNFFPKLDLSTKSSDQNSTKLQSGKNIKGSLTGQIQTYDQASGTYRIAATQNMLINGKSDSVILTGVIAVKDLAKDRTISSRKVANASIVYSGYVIGKERVVGEKDFDNLKFPRDTNSTNQKVGAQLTEAKKKELFLEYFNQLLNELF